MRIYNKLICSILISCICFGCIGCNSTSGKGTASSSEATVTIAARSGSHADVIKAVVEDFEKSNNCKINIESFDADELHDTIIADKDNEIATYDLIIMIDDPLMPEYIESGILTNLTQLGYSDDEDFVEKSKLLGKDPYPLGATYALPFSGNVQLIFYNPDLITNPSSLNNWSGILAACEEVNKNGKNGYAIRGQAGNPIVSDFLPILWAFGGDLFDESDHVILNSKESREALEFYCSLYQTGENYKKDDLIEAINSGNAAIALGWPSWFITGDGPTASIAQIPGKKSSTAETLPTGEIGNWLLGVPQNSQKQDIALKLAIYLTSADVQREAIKYGGVPTRKSIFRDEEVLRKYPYFEQLYSGTNNSRVRPRTTKWSQIEEVFGAELNKCINGEETVNDTLINSQKAIEALASQ